jgi:hypothetical protein
MATGAVVVDEEAGNRSEVVRVRAFFFPTLRRLLFLSEYS